MAFSKIILNGVALMDVTQDTVTAETLKQNETAHGADGVGIVGTMSSGGSVLPITSGAKFIDYDGTVVATYSTEQVASMTELPANPSHEGLIAQGWNWSLVNIKAYLTKYPSAIVNVGQMYITESGDTEIDVKMSEGRLSPIMTIAVNGTVTIDWGDNTTPDTITGTSVYTRLEASHTYLSAGNYTISVHAETGNRYSFYCSSTYTILRKNATANENRVYANCVRNVRLGNGINNIASNAFYYCHSLSSITIPDSVTSIEVNAFYYCYSLSSITIPDSVTSIGSNAFYGCFSIFSLIIPDSVTSIGSSTFSNCYSISSITIPDSVTAIGGSVFYYCASLSSITIPDSVTSIGSNAFYGCYSLFSLTIPDGVTSIGYGVFYGCYSLTSITIPDSVTSIGSDVFNICYGLKELHLLPTIPPTLGNAIPNASSDLVIYVPQGSLSAYQTDTNWSSMASQMQEESA